MEELWVGLDRARLFVRGWGERSGRPLLCSHGVGLTSRASLFLNEAGPLLADGYGLRVLALDAPGFGKSPPSERHGYQPHALVDLIPPLLEELGLARVAFVGFSWGGDLGCHLAARHPHSLAALVLLDAGYSDPPLDPSLTYEQRVERNELAWREKCAPSWDALVTRLRKNHPRWTVAVEEACRAGWRGQGSRLIPAVPPWVVAAVEHGMAHAPPSATRPRLAESRLPVLLVAAGDAAEEDLVQFAADVPQAEIVRAEGTGHDVVTDGGPEVVHVVGKWLKANDS
jgi:pimeloyl-ACP methyl ester carboxylesterase